MQMDARGYRCERVHALRQQRRDRTGQHVTGAGGCERGAVPATDRDTTGRLDDQRVVALKHNDRSSLLGGGTGVRQSLALHPLAVGVEQPS